MSGKRSKKLRKVYSKKLDSIVNSGTMDVFNEKDRQIKKHKISSMIFKIIASLQAIVITYLILLVRG